MGGVICLDCLRAVVGNDLVSYMLEDSLIEYLDQYCNACGEAKGIQVVGKSCNIDTDSECDSCGDCGDCSGCGGCSGHDKCFNTESQHSKLRVIEKVV